MKVRELRPQANKCKAILAGATLTLGMALLVNAEPPVRSGSTTSQVERSSTIITPLSQLEHARASRWGLAKTEWRRYRALMEGIRGSISPGTISPIEVLGIHARDDAERRKYAEQWAMMMREDAERILAFQHAYDQAWKRLFPVEPLIDPARLPKGRAADVALEPSDRVLFFTRPDCASCDALLRRLLEQIDTVAGVDIFLIGLSPDDGKAVRDWAEQQAIKPGWVRSRRVTLNHDGGALSQLTQGQGEVPYMLRRRGNALAVLSPSVL